MASIDIAIAATPPARTGMDRKIDKRPIGRVKLAATAAAVLAIGFAAAQIVRTSGVRTLVMPADRVTVSTVASGSFGEFIPIRGTVTPSTTVYLDAVEGGRVEQRFVEEGAFVERGEPIVELSNTALQLDVISREAQVAEQLNSLRNTRLAMEQNRLALQSALVEIDYQIKRLERLAERRGELAQRGLISRQDYEDAEDELEYYRRRRAVTIESQEQDERMRLAQIAALESGIEQLQRNLGIAKENLDDLVIRAPIAGQLTSLDAEIGAAKKPAERLGQIDDIERYKITALVDEFYISRVQAGQHAEVTLAGRPYEVSATKIYPEVRDGQLAVDLAFGGEPPPGVRRGQTLQLRLALGEASPALLLARGSFYDDTGGHWAFVLDETGTRAVQRPIRLGRGNPEHFEVLEGLAAGDRVITSSYAAFGGMDLIELNP